MEEPVPIIARCPHRDACARLERQRLIHILVPPPPSTTARADRRRSRTWRSQDRPVVTTALRPVEQAAKKDRLIGNVWPKPSPGSCCRSGKRPGHLGRFLPGAAQPGDGKDLASPVPWPHRGRTFPTSGSTTSDIWFVPPG